MGCASSTNENQPIRGAPGIKTEKSANDALYNSNKVLLKIILLGDSGAGKTSLMSKFVHHKFESAYKATIGADFLTKEFTVGQKKITMQIWDTAGQERYESLGSAFYRGADACVLVYDVNKVESYRRLEFWKDKFLTNSRVKTRTGEVESSVPAYFVVIGNKTDLINPATRVPEQEVQEWCQNNGNIPYIETSAKEGTNVEKAFQLIAQQSVKDIGNS